MAEKNADSDVDLGALSDLVCQSFLVNGRFVGSVEQAWQYHFPNTTFPKSCLFNLCIFTSLVITSAVYCISCSALSLNQ